MVVPIVVFVAVVMLVAILVPVAVSVVVSIPMVIVFKATAVPVPITGEVALAIMMRRYPVSARVRRASPIAGVPFVVLSYRVPIAFHPREIGSRTRRKHGDRPKRWRRADLDSDGDLSSCCPAEQEKSDQQACPNETCHPICCSPIAPTSCDIHFPPPAYLMY
jgi:hypothetical protein